MCSCDDLTGSVDSACVTSVTGSVVGRTGVSSVVNGAGAAGIASGIVGGTGVTCVVNGAGCASSVGVSGGVISGV